jgi:hypothetical protein
MNDLEICKRIAEIEGANVRVNGDFLDDMDNLGYQGQPHYYNPLTDDALCFKFAVDDKMMLSWVECPAGSGKAYFVNVNGKSTSYCDTPNRAVCMAKLKVFSDD